MIFPLFYIVTIIFLFYQFKKIDKSNSVSSIKRGSFFVVLLYFLLAISPLLFASKERSLYHFFLIWPLLYAVVFRDKVRSLLSFSRTKLSLRYISIFLLLWVTEIFLVIDYNRTGFAQDYGVEQAIKYGSLLSFGQHLFSYVGFYVGIAFVVGYFIWKYKISLNQTFLVGGIWGVLIEQNFLGIKLLFANPLTLITFIPWTFLAYGMYVVGPYLLFYEEIQNTVDRRETRFIKLKLFLCLLIIPLITWYLWIGILSII